MASGGTEVPSAGVSRKWWYTLPGQVYRPSADGTLVPEGCTTSAPNVTGDCPVTRLLPVTRCIDDPLFSSLLLMSNGWMFFCDICPAEVSTNFNVMCTGSVAV